MVQIKSMTGFGASEMENDNWRIRTEIKSLNNKFLEMNIRLPKSFKDKEIELRQMLTFMVGRGSVSISVIAEKKDNTTGDGLNINLALAKSYKDKLENMAKELKIATPDLWSTIMSLPDVIKYEELEGLDEDWVLIRGSVEKAFLQFDQFRLQEGKTIGLYLKECIQKIGVSLETVAKEEAARRENIKGRLMQSLADNKEDVKVDINRFEQEIIYYLEKYDIAEEKSRLRHHLDFFLECLEKEANGKKLSFISQEMGREINTLGSKAYFFPIQQAVVFMKEELEKIKEQLLNVL
jgi:uncharacterized protein (TIGR00255 family)